MFPELVPVVIYHILALAAYLKIYRHSLPGLVSSLGGFVLGLALQHYTISL